MERGQSGGHVGGWEDCDWSRRGVTSFFCAINMSLSKSKIGGGVSDDTRVEKNVNYLFFIHEKLPDRVFTGGNVGPDRVSRRASHAFLNRFRGTVTGGDEGKKRKGGACVTRV